ncbi:MAG: MCE family protein [Bacteroidales bacterium]|nr:MCE family protein [Bacteroidales bacterium]
MKKRKIILIGFLIAFTFAILIWGVTFIKNEDLFSGNKSFYGVYDKISGLVIDNPVLVRGIKVGKVKETGLCPKDRSKVYVKILLTEQLDIPQNSILEIVSADLLGSKAIEIHLGNSTMLAKSGDTLSTKTQKTLQEEVSMQVLPLKKKAEQLILSIDSLLASIQSVLNENTRENLRQSIENIRVGIEKFSQTAIKIDTLIDTETDRVRKILKNIDNISANINNNSENINKILTNLGAISDTVLKADIVNTINNANKSFKSLSDIVDKVNKGEGSLGMLINKDSVYRELEASSNQLNLLLEDMRLHPRRYVHFSVFGKSDKKIKYVAPDKTKK